MVKIWHGMTGDELPAPDDLSQEEISAIIDPAATGVPELSPINTLYGEKQAWEAKIETLDGEDKYIAMGEMARCLGQLDPLKAHSLAKQVLEKAADNNWVRARAEAYRASGQTPWFLLDLSFAERQTHLSNAVELFSFLELKVRKADVMLHHAMFESLIEGGFKRVTAKVWEARQLLLEPSDDEPLRHAALGIASHICAIIAWQSERDFELARGYWAIAVLHFRNSGSPFLVGLAHRAMALVLIDQMKYSAAKPHQIRASQIYRHNEMWNLYVIDCGRIATTQIKMGDLDGARRSLVQLKQVMVEKSITRNRYSLEYVEGYIKLHDEEWEQAISLLEPLMDIEALRKEVIVELLRDLSDAYDKTGKTDVALKLQKKALALQKNLFENRLEGNSRLFSLSDEIEKLQSKQKLMEQKTQRDDQLLKAILPPTAYGEIESTGTCAAEYYDNVALFYSDFAGFTKLAAGIPPRQLMDTLTELFEGFDEIMERHGCERIEAIGDAYLAVSGLSKVEKPLVNMARAAIEINSFLKSRNQRYRSLGVPEFHARIGLHHGSIVGGLIGTNRLRYAIFGDAVNTAQRLESGGEPDEVTVSETVFRILESSNEFVLSERTAISAKGKGMLPAWVLEAAD